MKNKLGTVGILTGMLLATGTAFSATAASAATPQAVATQSVSGVTVKGAPKLADLSALKSYVATNSTTVVTDATTGATVSVTAGTATGVSAQIAERGVCGSGDAYWQPSQTPYAQICFYGSAGSLTISPRSSVINWFTGKYTARGGWVYNGKQLYTLEQGPNSETKLTAAAQGDFGQIY